MAEEQHDVKIPADAEQAKPAKKKSKTDRHKSRKGGPSGPPLGKAAARGPRVKPPPLPKAPKAPPKLGAELGEPPTLLGAPPGEGDRATENPPGTPGEPSRAGQAAAPDALCLYLAGIRRRVAQVDEYVTEARRSAADTQRYASQAQAQAAEALRRVNAHRTEVAAWMERYTPERVQEIFERQQDWVSRTHRTVGALIQQMLVLTGVASCLDVLQSTPEGRLAILRAVLWTCDQGHDWWREHYRDERTIEGWAQWAVEQHRATERPDREYFKDRAPDYTADEEADRTLGMLGKGGTDPLAEEQDEDEDEDEEGEV